jgi:hypothetical protein
MDQPQAGRQEGLQPNGAGRRLLKGQALGFLVPGQMRRDDDVDQPLGQCAHHRLAVGLGAQRRVELEEAPIVRDVELVQG